MRLVLLVVVAIALGGCAGVEQDVSQLQQQQDALSAAIKKIKVVHGANLKSNPQYTVLGHTEGYCFNRPNSTGGQVIHGDGLRAAAYRKYGDQVNAIVNTTVWFVADDDYAAMDPYDEGGYFQCAGTAVHFTTPTTPATSPSPKPAS